MTGLLEGIRVLDFTQYVAGPACTRLMVEQGAEVTKLELPPHGDPSRGLEPRIKGRSAFVVQQNRGKRSVGLDYRTEEGGEIARRLARASDVVVENFSPGVMDRYGLGYEDLRAGNSGVIMASISGFGQTGPLSNRPAFDFIAQGYSGIAHMTGFADGPPLIVGSAIADGNAGIHAFAAISAALFRRERTGEGAYLDISMVDALIQMHESGIHGSGLSDTYRPLRQGRDYQAIAPAGVFQGPEGWIVLIVTANQIDNLWKALGRSDLPSDERFVGNAARLRNRAALNEIIETWMATFDSDDEVIDVLTRCRVPGTRVLSPADLAHQAHLRERKSIITIDDPVIGKAFYPGHPFTIPGVEPATDRPVEALGQSNREVLERLGVDLATVDALEEKGILHSKDRG